MKLMMRESELVKIKSRFLRLKKLEKRKQSQSRWNKLKMMTRYRFCKRHRKSRYLSLMQISMMITLKFLFLQIVSQTHLRDNPSKKTLKLLKPIIRALKQLTSCLKLDLI